MLYFAYSKYIFTRQWHKLMDSKLINNKSIREFVQKYPLSEGKLSSKMPLKLEFNPHFKKIAKNISEKTKKLDLEGSTNCPLYPLFNQNDVQYYLANCLVVDKGNKQN